MSFSNLQRIALMANDEQRMELSRFGIQIMDRRTLQQLRMFTLGLTEPVNFRLKQKLIPMIEARQSQINQDRMLALLENKENLQIRLKWVKMMMPIIIVLVICFLLWNILPLLFQVFSDNLLFLPIPFFIKYFGKISKFLVDCLKSIKNISCFKAEKPKRSSKSK